MQLCIFGLKTTQGFLMQSRICKKIIINMKNLQYFDKKLTLALYLHLKFFSPYILVEQKKF